MTFHRDTPLGEATPDPELGELDARYAAPRLVYDELMGPAGSPRAHWRPLIRALGRLGIGELAARGEAARQFLRENGVTYNVYGDSQGFERTWQLDPLPLLIPPGEWSRLEAGLIQRTRLLGRILEDLHGPQELLARHGLPPALVYSNPAFLRPCRGIRPVGGVPLFLHAVDLTRSPDGQWWVLGDRTQAPSGAGYALVNRIALSRVFPEEFRECQVERLAGFFQVVRDTLRGLAPQNRENPTVALLTPGAYNEAYFEHAYLARYLGFPLVEGGDLTVRDRRVFIKTLEGLRPVDVILRRVDDTFCDPLELRADSFLGVPGLVEAARAGNVAIANPLGSGIVETPAMLAFLPALCRQLLGEELRLPSVGTWWCGQERELRHVTGHLPQLVIKRAFPSAAGGEPLFGRELDPERREALLSDIRSAPHAYVGQEEMALPTAPVLLEGGLVPRSLVLRAFICASPDGVHVMPGGLTRIAAGRRGSVVSTQSGGSSKDTWVLTDGPVSTVTLLRPAPAVVRIERQPSEVPSRVADNLFWLGRYAERLEDTVRLLRVVISRLSGEGAAGAPPELPGLVKLLVALELVPAATAAEGESTAKIERQVLLLIYQASRLGSVREVLARLRHIAFVVRDRFTADTWRIFNKLQMDAQARPGHLPVTESLSLLNTLILDLAGFNGMAMENMTRGHGWLFLDIGRRLERILHVLSLLTAVVRTDPEGALLLDPLLEVADSVMTYRRRYFARPQLSGVIDLLLLDDTNPRSVAFQLKALLADVTELPSAGGGVGGAGPEGGYLEQAAARLRMADALELGEAAGREGRGGLAFLLEALTRDVTATSDALCLHYFTHADSRVS